MPNFGDSLNALSAMWDETKPQSMDLIPDGMYDFLIESCELTSKDDKNNPGEIIPCVVTKYVCLSDAFKGKTLTSWDQLNNPKSVQFFKEKLRRLGINPMTPITELELALKDVVRCLVTAKITNKKGNKGDMIFTNIYIQSNNGKDTSVPV